METQTQNLRRLIDTGKRENIEMAVQLSTNFKPESKWLHDYAAALLLLPTQYKSWLQLYIEAMRYDHDRISVPFRPRQVGAQLRQDRLMEVRRLELTMDEIRQSVANEYTYLMTSMTTQDYTDGLTEMAYRGFSVNVHPDAILLESNFRKFMRGIQRVFLSLKQ